MPEEKASLVRRGAVQLGRRFVGKFAARFDGEGLGPRAAAEAAIVDLARDGLRALLAPLRTPPARRARLPPADPPDPRPKSKGRSRPKKARPDPREPGDPLARLKRSIVPGDGTR
jgi:hypothetical protein